MAVILLLYYIIYYDISEILLDSVNDTCNSVFQKVSKQLSLVVAVSSMRGIETDFKGDTLDFPMTKLCVPVNEHSAEAGRSLHHNHYHFCL